MDDIIIDIGNDISINGGDNLFIGDTDIITESETTQGPPGPQGPAGRDATVSVGSTTTGAPGTYASVSNSSQDPSSAVLEFTIPRGADGAPGQDGVSPTITVGDTTTLDPSDPATVTNSGTSDNIILDFAIPRGYTGNTGPAGVDGISPIAYVEPITGGGRLVVEDSEHTTTVDIMDGTDGTDGQDGQAATITVGSTTTGAAGTSASVTNSGTSSAAILDFVIPKGDTGDTGPAGADGADGAPGAAATISVGSTTTGNPGTSASVTNSGTSSSAVFNFVIPRGADGQNGADGQDGQDGAPGAAATIAVGSVTTGAAGSSASVTNSGTSSAAVFDFVIPKGDTGATGATGSQGPQGPQGEQAPPGVAGDDGFSPTASVSKVGDTATITITDQIGITTASISDGAQGPAGAAATIAVGTVSSLTPGSTPTVSNSGTSSAAVFDFGIPTSPSSFSDLTGTVANSQLTDTGWVIADSYLNTQYFTIRNMSGIGQHIYYRVIAGVVYWKGGVYCHSSPNTQEIPLMTDLPDIASPDSECTFYGSLYTVNNSDYALWLDYYNGNRMMLRCISQNIPSTYDFQSYNLGQISYVSKTM